MSRSTRYVLDIQPTEQGFKELQKRITELYPEYVTGDKKTYADGSGYAKFEKGENVITAERDMENKVISVTSDEPLDELINIYRLERERIQSQDAQPLRLFEPPPEEVKQIFAGTSRRVKFILLPLLIYLAAAVICLFEIGIYSMMYIFEVPIEMAPMYLKAVKYLGQIWLIPAGFICAGTAMIKTKTAFACKAAAMSLPAVTAAYFISHNPDIFYGDILEWLVYALICLLSPDTVILILAAVYPLLLPYIIIDEIVCTMHEKTCGSRPNLRQSAIGWVCSAAGVIAVLLCCAAFYNFSKKPEINIQAAQQELDDARAELILNRYFEDMAVIAKYAYEHNFSDWSECPDESLEYIWLRLFEESSHPFDGVSVSDGKVYYISEGGLSFVTDPETGETEHYEHYYYNYNDYFYDGAY